MAEETLADVPVGVRVQFAHASVQAVADRCGADVLHIKGPSVDPETNPGRSLGGDADVLVRPRHVRDLVRSLADAGWVMWCDFDEGSRFEHAASFWHEQFGMLDVHQNFPGLHNDPAGSFGLLWQARGTRRIADIECAVPDRVGERLILLLHAARTSTDHCDVRNHWTELPQAERDRVQALADRLGAVVGLALATGRADTVAGHRELALWREYQGEDSRLGEWVARWRAAPGVRARWHLVVRAPRVNRFQLGQRLGRPPTRAEVRAEWWRRAARGTRAAGGVLGGRMRRGRH